uniref:UDP-N-acetylmuramoyl-L-alanyl-D-glutamate--2,6-diaminopimelate ligase n=1 Tax=Chlorobium chlorochromatii (strain CaD3) TaxID=340177 RepID=Q3ANV8_CHLCH
MTAMNCIPCCNNLPSLTVGAFITALQAVEVTEQAGACHMEHCITAVSSDSRDMIEGALFVAVRGFCTDGHRFIESAIERGACIIVCEELPQSITHGCLYLRVIDARKALAHVAALFYGNPAKQLRFIGVTGTNGKTTTSRIITEMLTAFAVPSGYIGTNLCRIGKRDIPLERTTPEAHELHALFALMVEAGCKAVVMEVSSHALLLQRVYGLRFDAALFTNLTQDHLDFHHTMQAYAEAKQLLFDQLQPDGVAIVNTDDAYAPLMLQRVAPSQRVCCTLQANVPSVLQCPQYGQDFQAEVRHASLAATEMELRFPKGETELLTVGLAGSYNVMNVLQAAATGYCLGLQPAAICRALAAVHSVDGRMERVGRPNLPYQIFVDYAHTPDALQKALETLKALKGEEARLMVLFGCGGNRDRLKRPIMGSIAASLADVVILTSDNPRDESPDAILDEIEQGMQGAAHQRIADRAEAIRTAISQLQAGDVLLIAGKGHERYQEVAGKRTYFSDQEEVGRCL